MKKLILNASAFQKGDVLTRTQLKNILGGFAAPEGPVVGTGPGDDCNDECGETKKCSEGKTCKVVNDMQDCNHYTQRCL